MFGRNRRIEGFLISIDIDRSIDRIIIFYFRLRKKFEFYEKIKSSISIKNLKRNMNEIIV
jgi:hypothetical protein